MSRIVYPSSFPNATEERFLTMLLSADADFPKLWLEWKKDFPIDAAPYAIFRLLPLIAKRIATLSVTDSENTILQGLYKKNRLKNQLLINNVKKIFVELQKNSVPVIALKGLALIYSAYQDIGVRYMDDIDILVKPEHAIAVSGILAQLGFRHENDITESLTANIASIKNVVKSNPFTSKQLDIDVHYDLFDMVHYASFTDLLYIHRLQKETAVTHYWQQAKSLAIDTYTILQLSPEDMFAHIVIHGSFGNKMRTMRWVVDAVTLARTQPINWSVVVANARTFNFEVALLTALDYLITKKFLLLSEYDKALVYSLSITPTAQKKYLRFAEKGNDSYTLFGNFPTLWYSYFMYECVGKSRLKPSVWYGFISYLVKNYGLTSPFELFTFICKKYILRIHTLFTKTKRQ